MAVAKIDLRRKHGMAASPTHKTWVMMRQRCYNPAHHYFARYGGRGIRVCDRWLNSFENFVADMGIRPAGTTLDRFPNRHGDYEPGNCRWADPRAQQANRDITVLLTAFGRTMPLADWARESGMNPEILRQRIVRGWPHHKAVTLSTKLYRTERARFLGERSSA